MRLSTLLALLITSYATVALAGSDNILKNVAFSQTTTTGLPSDWMVFCPPVNNASDASLTQGSLDLFAVDTDTLYKGKATLRISSLTPVRVGLLQTNLPASVGQTIRFSGWIKANGIKNSGNEGAWIRLGFSNLSDPSKQAEAYKYSKFLKSPSDTFDWLYVEGEATVPAEADHVEFGMFLWRTSGTVWFANPRVELIDSKH